MSRSVRYALLGTLAVLIIISIAVWQRHIVLFSLAADGTPPPLLPRDNNEQAAATWFDDYFIVIPIQTASGLTYAIGEPRYYQQNFNYLIIGSERAVLFDAGSGGADIRPVVASLTDLPLTFLPSHLHYDHIGNRVTFEHVALIDLPYLRSRAPDNQLPLVWAEHLGSSEGIDPPILRISEWLAPNSLLDLGGRELKVLHTPGHTSDSASLYDVANQLLFSGDFLYPGNLYAFLPNSSLPDYAQATARVAEVITEQTRIFGAHRVSAPDLPELGYADLDDLRGALDKIRSGALEGSGSFPLAYQVNEKLVLLAEPVWLQRW